MATRETYSEEYKQKIYPRLVAGESITSLAKETGVKKKTLQRWKSIAKRQDEAIHQGEPKEIDHNLPDENYELKKAYSYLKEQYELLKSENKKLNDANKFLKEENDFLFNRYSALREKI